jgi:hypothetical protein
MGVGCQCHAPAALHPGKIPDTQCVGTYVGPRADLGCGISRHNQHPTPGQ